VENRARCLAKLVVAGNAPIQTPKACLSIQPRIDYVYVRTSAARAPIAIRPAKPPQEQPGISFGAQSPKERFQGMLRSDHADSTRSLSFWRSLARRAGINIGLVQGLCHSFVTAEASNKRRGRAVADTVQALKLLRRDSSGRGFH